MKILFLANWKIHRLAKDSDKIQPTDKVVDGEKYWFFKYWPGDHNIDVVDFSQFPIVHRLEKRYLKFYVIQALKALPRIRDYDVVISHGAQSAIFLLYLQSLFGLKGPPHVLIDVGCFNGARDNRIETSLIKYASRSLSGIIYHAIIQKKYYERHLPLLLDSCFYLPFGCDVDFFVPLDEKVDDYIVAIGFWKRDYPTLIKAWDKIQTNTRLKIVGVEDRRQLGVDKTSPLRNIDLLPFMPISKLKEIIARSKFVVLPLPDFDYAYGQKTLLEAMAMKKAVVVTKTPSTEAYATDLETAVFTSPYDIEDLRIKIDMLLNNTDITSRIAQNAAISIASTFTAEQMAQKIYEIVERICNVRNPQQAKDLDRDQQYS